MGLECFDEYKRVLKEEEKMEFLRRSPLRVQALLLCDWLIIAFVFWLSATLKSVWLAPLWVVVLARQQHAILILLHEAVHGGLSRSRMINDFLGIWLCGSPFFFSLNSYRKIHLKHHQCPMSLEDPDLSLTGGYPISQQSYRRKLIRDITGQSQVKTWQYFNNIELRDGDFRIYVSYVFTQTVIIGFNVMLGAAWQYSYWLLSWFFVLPIMLRLRGIFEHAGYQHHENQALCTRTVVNILQNLFLTPHSVNFHVEHHLYPKVSCIDLPKVHRLLKERGVLTESNFSESYFDVFRSLVRNNI